MANTVVFPAPQDPASTKMVVAFNVRLLMTERGVTQVALAAAMGLPQPSISRRLRGLTPWDTDDLDKLKAIFGVALDRLVLPRLDSNQQPADSESSQVATVIQFPDREVR